MFYFCPSLKVQLRALREHLDTGNIGFSLSKPLYIRLIAPDYRSLFKKCSINLSNDAVIFQKYSLMEIVWF